MLSDWFADPTALATFALVLVTAGLVILAYRQATLARRSLEMAIRPLLADPAPGIEPGSQLERIQFGAPGRNIFEIPEGSLFHESGGGIFQLSVAFRNVGAGVAVVGRAATHPKAAGSVFTSKKFVPVGEHVRVNVSILVTADEDRLAGQWWAMDGFAVSIDYTDAEGKQCLTSRAEIRQFATQGPFVQQIAISHTGTSQAIVVGQSSV
jgi:hypothetical protein